MDDREKLLAFLTNQAKIPYLPEEIAVMLDAPDRLSEITTLLDEFCREGLVIKSKKGRYQAAAHQNIFTGTYRHNPKGFGFVTAQEGEDFFIPPDSTNGAFDGDKVSVKLLESKKHEREGIVCAVIERANKTVSGVYKKGFVIPTNTSIDMKLSLVPRDDRLEGSRLVVRVLDYEKQTCELVLNLGSAKDMESALLAIMHSHDIPFSFPDEVLAEAESFSDNADSYTEKRNDYRNLLTITIDGPDARDLDDAISVFKTENGLRFMFILPTFPNLYATTHLLTGRLLREAPARISPTGLCPCCRRHCQTGYVLWGQGFQGLPLRLKWILTKTARFCPMTFASPS